MSLALPLLTIILCIIFGHFIKDKITVEFRSFSSFAVSTILGIVLFSATVFYLSFLAGFPKAIIYTHIIIAIFLLYELLFKNESLGLKSPSIFFPASRIFSFIPIFKKMGFSLAENKKHAIRAMNIKNAIQEARPEILLLTLIGFILFMLFDHHILSSANGAYYTGESTYGDLPFHLSTIAELTFSGKFPPEHPFFAGIPLVYPYLTDLFSAVLAHEGLSLRYSIIIPGLILSLCLIGLVYDFAYELTKKKLTSFIATLLYFFNGGLGFYYFLKDNRFEPSLIIGALFNPGHLTEYSHLFEQNIQWGNFLSRMVIPERALLFGIPLGIIILRLLFINTNNFPAKPDIILAAILLSLMPIAHTHTVLVFSLILPILAIFLLSRQYWKKQLMAYFITAGLTIIFVIPLIPLFLGHVMRAGSFFNPHYGWMKGQESMVWFWFKNTYLLIPAGVILCFIPGLADKKIKILQLCAFALLFIVNVVLISPYDWDNVKLLFWFGLFTTIAAAILLNSMLAKNAFSKTIAIVILITMASSAMLSILREINVTYILFPKESIELGEYLKSSTPQTAVFLTYKTHNSPVSNLAGRSIIMGYPGILWTQGINYSSREQEINSMYSEPQTSQYLFNKYNISYVVIEPGNSDQTINREYFAKYPAVYKGQDYTVYRIK